MINKFRKLALVACLFVTTTLTTSCVIEKTASRVPDDQFIFIKQDHVANICNLLEAKCKMGESKESGSGVIVGHNKNKSYILTAAHVCLPGPTPEQVPPFIQYTVLSSNLIVHDADDKAHEAKIFAFDRKTDLCLVESERISKPAIPFAKKAPKRRGKVTNVAAPYGVWADGQGVLYKGYYFGNLGDDAYYILTVMPGSSGSPVVNKHGQLVGIISRGTENAEIAISPTHGQIKLFLEEHPF
jgi:S1-C subfamily serine protease